MTLQAIYERIYWDGSFDAELQEGGFKFAKMPLFTTAADKSDFSARHTLDFFHNRLSYGAEYVYHRYDWSIHLPPEMEEHRFGVYLQDEVDLAAMLKDLGDVEIWPLWLTAGVRLDYNTVSFWEISPRASLVCQPANKHAIRLGYAHAFRKPKLLEAKFNIRIEDIADLGFDQIAYQVEGRLRNRTIDSLEAGYLGTFLDGHLLVGLDFAYSWYRNPLGMVHNKEFMIQIGDLRIPDFRKPGFWAVKNDPEGLGGPSLELQLVIKPIERIRLFANLGYSKLSYLRKDEPYDREPVWRLAVGADLESSQGLSLAVRAYYTDSYLSKTTLPGTIILQPALGALLTSGGGAPYRTKTIGKSYVPSPNFPVATPVKVFRA